MRRGILTRNGHFVVLTGIDTNKNVIYINDPNGSNNLNPYPKNGGKIVVPIKIFNEDGKECNQIGSQAKSYWIYEK
jgi:hypothetical protein